MRTIRMTAHCRRTFFILFVSGLSTCAFAQAKNIRTIELRNYLLRPGQRDNYINAFETRLVDTLNLMGNYVLGQYRVKGANDNFVWIRGFDDMATRKKALEQFFASEFWARNQSIPGKYLVNYTNVYLLKPVSVSGNKIDSTSDFDPAWFGRQKGIAVVDFYIANDWRNQLLDVVRTWYDSVRHAAGIKEISYWISEPTPNNYPDLPAFQDKNLLATISFFKDEPEYKAAAKRMEAGMNEEQKFEWNRLVATKTTWILYPTARSFRILKK